jgi:hypothetical protein
MGAARNKTLGAQLHMMVNIPVKFHDCDSHTFCVMCDTSFGRTDGLKDGWTDKGKPICPPLSEWGHNKNANGSQ